MSTPGSPSAAGARHRTVEALFGDRIVEWVLASDEPAARFAVRTAVLGEPEDSPGAAVDRQAGIATRAVRDLVETLPRGWSEAYERRDSLRHPPNALLVLHDLGVRRGDFPSVDAVLEELLESRDRHGRFIGHTAGSHPTQASPPALCDAHAVLEVALRYGLRDDPRVERALEQALVDMRRSDAGRAWCCEARSRLLALRRQECEICPHATVHALRAFALLPASERPALAAEAARALLAVWSARDALRPSGFGHGYQFAAIKWPHLWYDALAVVEAVTPYTVVWAGAGHDPGDRRALAEVAATLIDTNLDAEGRVVPQRVAPGFRDLSVGRKGEPSPLATAFVLAAIRPLAAMSGEIAAVEPARPRTVRRHAAHRTTCVTLEQPAEARTASVVARQLARQHIGTPWIQASPETFVSDIVAFPVIDPRAPFLAVADRLGADAAGRLATALYERRTLVTFRCMRGGLHVVRADMLPIVAQATGRAVRHHSARFLGSRGITARHYEVLAERILDALADGPLSAREIRERLRPHADVSAVLTHMCNEGLVVRDLPEDGPWGRKPRFARFDTTLPGLRLDDMSEEQATRELVRAYVRAYAPVTEADIAWWTGAGPRRTARALEEIADELAEVRVAGFEQAAFVHLADADELEAAAIAGRPVVALLPAGDPLLSSRRQRGIHVPDAVRSAVFDKNGRPAPAIAIDGVVRGVWDLTRSGDVLLYAATPLDDVQRSSIEHRAAQVASALGAPGHVRWVDRAPELGRGHLSNVVHPLSSTPGPDAG
ncbi:MAG: winged helix DNA-binding domain-containing protein [Anaerosomatales bacterium]|nr:winged helix DNA-binding domain-containing protein [Anaerosomatales bacterium]